MQCLVVFCNQLEEASDIVSGKFVRQIVFEKCVKFGSPRLNCSRDIYPKPSEAVFSTFFGYNFRPEVDRHIISSVAIDYVQRRRSALKSGWSDLVGG